MSRADVLAPRLHPPPWSAAICSATTCTQSYSLVDLNASPQDIAKVRASAEGLVQLFPVVDSQPGEDDVVKVSNFDTTDVILARSLSYSIEDLNPDPATPVPRHIVELVVERLNAPDVAGARAPSRKRAVDDSFVPRRSDRLAGKKADDSAFLPGLPAPRRRRLSVGYRALPAPPRSTSSIPGSLWSYETRVLVGEQMPEQMLSEPSALLHDCSSISGTARSTSVSLGATSPPALGRRAKKNAKKRASKAASLASNATAATTPSTTVPSMTAPSTSTFVFAYRIAPFSRRGLTYRKAIAGLAGLDTAGRAAAAPSQQPARRHHSDEYYARRRKAYYASLSLEAYQPRPLPTAPDAPAVLIEKTNRTVPGWRGYISRRRIQDVLKLWGTPRLSTMLEGMHIIPYRGMNSFFCDMHGRGVVFRSTPIADAPGQDIIDEFYADAMAFSRNCPVPASERIGNPRGSHFFCVCGVHRQYAKKAYRTRYQLDNQEHIDHLFRRDGPADRLTSEIAQSSISKYLTGILRSRFPSIVQRMERNHKWHEEDTKRDAQPLRPQFGLFWNFCINAPSPETGITRVCCRPHADQMNCAVLLCAVLPFWPKECVGEDEWSWLVIWELGVIIQCPRGAFIIYPSALFFHFNIRIVKCRKGEQPTPFNSEELPADLQGGRASAVWFTQASMHSVTDERDPETGFYPDYDRMARELFPLVFPGESGSAA
ncbi:hypothetical protein AURDEDRAFT_131381 [Auricularia subglabra TFB-10046 SS5]|uniref:Uncharacterized protein n=1 Tax=Auricularia subglabra (strain TFB-10046 / SS5) TaxID=717982 RepID=J0LC31_AURST|nr:hypothetical protein AURDEDRAFT_131381 [Auricularia subglabra TFB-10046 SS5]